MSSNVEVWMGELAKLKEKFMAQNQKTFFSKAKEGSEQAVEKVAEKEIIGATISEATLCLLMDRFVPC